jgi:hypothetical protein
MDDTYVSWCLQEDIREWIDDYLGHETWLPLYKPGASSFEDRPENQFVWSFLIDSNSVGEELNEYTFHQFDGYPCTDDFKAEGRDRYYSRFGYEDREPILFRRRFPTREGYIEISQEFIHFFQLFHDRKSNCHILEHDHGGEETVIKTADDGDVSVRTYRMKQFLAFKRMALVVGISNMRHFNRPIGQGHKPRRTSPLLEKANQELHYALWYQDGIQTAYLTEVLGKKVILGMPVENTGIYPFETDTDFETFVIGIDDQSNAIEHSCNPDTLSNYFGANPGAPHYLTPVYFSRDVLSKYYSDPGKYRVGDGHIVIGSYHLRADTNHADYVVVFLGDLGRDIPLSEQRYWKSFNILPEGGMSSTAIRRAFFGEFADPEAEHFLFTHKYSQLQDEWLKRFGWSILKPLNKEDEYRLSVLRVPLAENQQEFDQMVEHLTIILVESINDKSLKRVLTDAGLADELKGKRSIGKLALFLRETCDDDTDEQIEFLKGLWWLRTKGSAHRKGSKEYAEVREHFKLDAKGYIVVSRELLKRATEFVEFLRRMTHDS